MQTEVARWRQIASQARAESQAHHAALLEESRKRKSLLADFENEVRQTIEERAEWQATVHKLEIEAHGMTEHLNEEARQHRTQLAALSSRAEMAETALATLRADAKKQERLFQKRIEQIQIKAASQKVKPRRESSQPCRLRRSPSHSRRQRRNWSRRHSQLSPAFWRRSRW